MDNVVNLNKFRKAKAKGQKHEKSAENRRKSGRTKGEKAGDKASQSKDARKLDGHKLEDAPSSDPGDEEPA